MALKQSPEYLVGYYEAQFDAIRAMVRRLEEDYIARDDVKLLRALLGISSQKESSAPTRYEPPPPPTDEEIRKIIKSGENFHPQQEDGDTVL